MWTRLAELESTACPFDAAFAPSKSRWSRRTHATERWVTPTLVAEVSFAEWTSEGSIRHASFEGLRNDKDARSIRREAAVLASPTATSQRASPAPAKRIKVSNPERVIDISTGLTKVDLVRYYESVADWILPHLAGRPTSLVRGPEGIGGELFFQKHGDRIGIPGLRELDASLWPGHKSLLEIPNAEALVGAAQLNVIEFHTWNAPARNIEHPDRMIFDLDPGDGVTWASVQEGATLTRVMLTELGLDAWLKTSGGKGLHIVVPISPRLDYDTVNEFSKAVVVHLAKTIPSRFVAKSGGGNRVGRIFVDSLRTDTWRDHRGEAFGACARPGLGVSMPVHWGTPGRTERRPQWTIATAREHLSLQKDDPWKSYWKSKQTLTLAMKILDFDVKPPVRKRKA